MLTRRRFLQSAGAGGLALLVPDVVRAQTPASTAAASAANVVVRWNDAFLEAVRQSKLGPPMVARALAVAHTCIYDAWAAYDRTAVGTRFGGRLRRPPRERRYANKAEALSYAAYRAGADLFPAQARLFDALMEQLGFDPGVRAAEARTPAGIGNLAAAAVLSFRHGDGANQVGDAPGAPAGVPYADYTGFVAANEPMDTRGPLDPKTVHDPSAWQPLTYVDASGRLVTPGFVGAQWQRVRPFAMASSRELRSPNGPARYGTAVFERQARELVEISANLTDRQKMIAEYWADGPHSELPPGPWNLFAQQVVARDCGRSMEHELDRAVRLFLALTNAVFDAGCCAWDNKRAYASVRPITAVRYLYAGKKIRAWAGPGRGAR